MFVCFSLHICTKRVTIVPDSELLQMLNEFLFGQYLVHSVSHNNCIMITISSSVINTIFESFFFVC